MASPAIRVSEVSKTFRRADVVTVRDVLSRRRRRPPFVPVLRAVSFSIAEGTTTAIVGVNGVGKSTLLRLVAGVLAPDAGTIEVRGRVGALLELGAGFHPELTAREAAVVTAVIAGMSRRDARARLDDVLSFAGLESFADQPLRTFSTGMQARLAFAVATCIDPEILLIDEVLAVGDLAFQHRCIERLRQFQRDGVTILFVSHDPDLTSALCTDALWLRAGAVAAAGPVDEVLSAYAESSDAPARAADEAAPDGIALQPGATRFGSLAARLRNIEVRDGRGKRLRTMTTGDPLEIAFEVDMRPEVGDCNVSVKLLRDDDGSVLIETSTPVAATAEPAIVPMALRFDRLDLAPGDYVFDVGLYDVSWETVLDVHVGLHRVRVLGSAGVGALLAPPSTWERRAEHGRGAGGARNA